MSIYDVLDTVRDINDDVYTAIITGLSSQPSKFTALRQKVEQTKKSVDVLAIAAPELELKTYLTEMEYADLEDRMR